MTARRRTIVAGFHGFVERVGVVVAAERLGVTTRTVRGWVKLGLPIMRAQAARDAVGRNERAVRASAYAKAYRERGWVRLRGFEEVDRAIGAKSGHTRERWQQRKEWWEDHRPDEQLAKRMSLIRTRNGQVLYVNGDLILWRAYTVNGLLFWTQSTYLEGYDTADDMKRRYKSLRDADLQILF